MSSNLISWTCPSSTKPPQTVSACASRAGSTLDERFAQASADAVQEVASADAHLAVSTPTEVVQIGEQRQGANRLRLTADGSKGIRERISCSTRPPDTPPGALAPVWCLGLAVPAARVQARHAARGRAGLEQRPSA